MQDHRFSIDVEGTAEEVWRLFWIREPRKRTHGDVTIEILHPGDEVGQGLVRHCYFRVPRWLLSGGVGQSWEWLTEVKPYESWKYDAIGKPLWSRAEGWTRLEDLGGGRCRVHFRETYYAFNPVMRFLFEKTVHDFISKDNDKQIQAAVNEGLRQFRAAQPPQTVPEGEAAT